ncbi:hypothetical protein MYCSP_18935 [Mycobacteroides saopaulense]|nr:hypothetical protein MYCSP_18935 [Mycobacteroides saopaulense]
MGLGRRCPLLEILKDLGILVVQRAHQSMCAAGPFQPHLVVTMREPAREPAHLGQRGLGPLLVA